MARWDETGRPRSLRGNECSTADGASRSASVRADEWGGEADELGHTKVAFLGNAVKTLEVGWRHVLTTGQICSSFISNPQLRSRSWHHSKVTL